MCLDWNKIHRQVLASGSADTTVKIWDVTSEVNKPSNTYTCHKGKVQSVRWHPSEGTILASGGFDKLACLLDCRQADSNSVRRVKISADCEAIAWDPHKQERLVIATEDGLLTCYDVRNLNEHLWQITAGEYGVSDVSFSPNMAGMIATCAIDKTVNIWDAHCPSLRPTKVHSREMGAGKLYTCGFYPSSDWLLGVGGTGGALSLWEMGEEELVVKTFSSRRVTPVNQVPDELDEEEPLEAPQVKDEDFERMMAAGDAAAANAAKGLEKKGAGKKKNSKKKPKARGKK